MPEQFKIVTKLSKPVDCMGCPLETEGTGFSIPEGKGTLGVLMIGEALGYHEAKDGLPFRPWAPAGSVLERAIRQCGYSREQFALWNLIGCKPIANDLVGKPWELEAIEHCRVHLNRVMGRFRPRVILALGATALRSLSKMAGKKQNLDMIRGYALDCPEFAGVPVIGTYHPSYIIRGNFNVFNVLCRDLKFAVSYAAARPAPVKLNYVENAGPYELNHLIELCEKVPNTIVCPDVETPGDADSTIELLENSGSDVEEIESSAERVALGLDKKEGKGKKKQQSGRIRTDQAIIQMNIAVEPTNAMAFAMTPENKRLMQRLFRLPNPKVNHNMWFFDQPVMEYNDIQVNGRLDDTLWLFHHLFPDVPGKGSKASDDKPDGSLANLQYCASFSNFPFPWKHLSEARPEFYGCCDVHSDLELFTWLKREASAMGVWDGYERMVREIAPILIDAARRGIPINREKLMTFRKSVRANAVVISTGIQQLIPDELRGTQPKNGYKRRPKSVDGMVLREFFVEGKVERCECNKIRKKDIEKWQQVPGAAYDAQERLRAPDVDCFLCGGVGYITIQDHLESRWCSLKPFLVTSPQQMKAYAASKHHNIPKNSKKKYAMDRETLDRLIKSTGDPLYSQAIDLRECVKMDSTYGAGWMPHSDGFVHTQFSFLPSTGQLSSTGPNVQNVVNVSKKGQIAIEFNSAIEALPGYVLTEFDYKSFHAQTLGIEAGDMSYVRLARLDLHSYVAAQFLKLPYCDVALSWEDEELKAWLKWYRKNYTLKNGDSFEKLRNKQAKPAGLAYGFGIGGRKLFETNRDSFNNMGEADRLIDTLNGEFPITAQFRETIPLVAAKSNRLISRFCCPRWFWDVRRFNPQKRDWEHGKDWEKAIAYLPANHAFCHKKQALKVLYDAGLCDRYGFINDVHDALKFHTHESVAEESLYAVKDAMEFESEVLMLPDGNRFSCEVEVKRGKSWATLEEVHV